MIYNILCLVQEILSNLISVMMSRLLTSAMTDFIKFRVFLMSPFEIFKLVYIILDTGCYFYFSS